MAQEDFNELDKMPEGGTGDSPFGKGKARADIDSVQAGIDKVSFAAAQMREALGNFGLLDEDEPAGTEEAFAPAASGQSASLDVPVESEGQEYHDTFLAPETPAKAEESLSQDAADHVAQSGVAKQDMRDMYGADALYNAAAVAAASAGGQATYAPSQSAPAAGQDASYGQDQGYPAQMPGGYYAAQPLSQTAAPSAPLGYASASGPAGEQVAPAPQPGYAPPAYAAPGAVGYTPSGAALPPQAPAGFDPAASTAPAVPGVPGFSQEAGPYCQSTFQDAQFQPAPAQPQYAPVGQPLPAQPAGYAPTQQSTAAQDQFASYRQGPPAQAHPAGYSQSYMPQIQQAPAASAVADFSVPPQPSTPAYAKSNRSTLGIVVVVVVCLLAIIAAIAIGRVLWNNSDGSGSTIIDTYNDIESQLEEELGLGQGEGPDGGHKPGQDGSGSWGAIPDEDFNWDDLENLDWEDLEGLGFNDDSFSNTPYSIDDHGVMHYHGGGVEADDGELHDGWDPAVAAYSLREEDYELITIEKSDAYNATVAIDFDIDYPQLDGADASNKHFEEVNDAIRAQAMSSVEDFYLNPTDSAKNAMKNLLELDLGLGVPDDVDAILECDVDYAISYNTDDFVSVCFSEVGAVGSYYGSFIGLRTLNANPVTGEIYQLEDVLELNEDIANSFIDNYSMYDGGLAEESIGRDAFVDAILGKGAYASKVKTTFFVDGNGKVNLGVSYRLGEGEGDRSYGWWDYTLTDEQLEKARKDSTLWDALAKG